MEKKNQKEEEKEQEAQNWEYYGDYKYSTRKYYN